MNQQVAYKGAKRWVNALEEYAVRCRIEIDTLEGQLKETVVKLERADTALSWYTAPTRENCEEALMEIRQALATLRRELNGLQIPI